MNQDVAVDPGGMAALLDQRVKDHPDRVAFVFAPERESEQALTYAELATRARALARGLVERGATGERVLLLYPTGLEFIVALFGCLYAGAVAVPSPPPRPGRGESTGTWIAANSEPCLALSTARILDRMRGRGTPELANGIRWDTVESVSLDPTGWRTPVIDLEDLALLQYTSGSTSKPKGVMISHANLLSNLALIQHGSQLSPGSTGVFCLPLYHDMGLVGTVLEPVHVGGTSVLLSPVSLVRSPLRWLRMISERQADITCAPNFAYALCIEAAAGKDLAGLNLESLRLAFCGAEPVRAQTLTDFARAFASVGFARDAFYPCYGLAEATLMVSGGFGPRQPTTCTVRRSDMESNRVVFDPPEWDRQTLIGCGTAMLDTRVEIVDPEKLVRCADDQVGEIWVAGPAVASGYWKQPAATRATFQATLADTAESGFLRTGDLGFLHQQELYITGRLSERIVIRGRNLYPQDIEQALEQRHSDLRPGGVAAFSVDVDDTPQLVVTCELQRSVDQARHAEIARIVRRTLFEEFGVESYAVRLLESGSLPKTTSGKTRRAACRELFLNGQVQVA